MKKIFPFWSGDDLVILFLFLVAFVFVLFFITNIPDIKLESDYDYVFVVECTNMMDGVYVDKYFTTHRGVFPIHINKDVTIGVHRKIECIK